MLSDETFDSIFFDSRETAIIRQKEADEHEKKMDSHDAFLYDIWHSRLWQCRK